MHKLWSILKIAIIPAIWWLLEHPERYDKIKASFIKPFINWSKNLQKFFLKNSLQGKINSFNKSVNKQIGEKEEYRLVIQWAKETDFETFIKNNDLIVKMDYKDNMCRNLTIATLAYISSTLLRKTRPYIDKDLNEAINLMVTKKIFDSEAEESEKEYYNNIFLFPKLKNLAQLKSDCEKIEFIDQKGIFTRLFLRELQFFGKLLDGAIPNKENETEIRDFLNYIESLAKTPLFEHKDPIRLTEDEWRFYKRYLRVQFVLFAASYNVILTNTRPYRKRIKDGIKIGIDIFYLLARKNSAGILNLLEQDIDRSFVKHGIFRKTYKGSFVIGKSKDKSEKIHSVVYRTSKKFKGIDVDTICEDTEELNQESR